MIREELARLQHEYQTRAAPLVKRLAEIEMLKPRHIWVDPATGKVSW